jgi:hypothetical protein
MWVISKNKKDNEKKENTEIGKRIRKRIREK